ncbi:helix-turn-helix transcriptional regulator [Aeromonas rivipollensis]
MENNSPTPNARLIRIREAIQKTGLSKSTIYDLMAAGRFPQSVRLSARCVAFVEYEVDAWIASRIAERNDRQAA